MREILVDTQGWVALKHRGDSFYGIAKRVNQDLLLAGGRYVTTTYILDETYTLLLIRIGHRVAVEFGEEIRSSRLVEVIHINEYLEEEAWIMFKRYSDKAFSFTDCTSFAVMRERGIQEAFTNDHHFEQAGFQRLLQQ